MAGNGKIPREQVGITKLTISGFKSIMDETEIEIRPLTILAGANSSGKSSIIQPLLMMKQTLEAPYDPGPLLLNGTNVKFDGIGQFLPRIQPALDQGLIVTIEIGNNSQVTSIFDFVSKGDDIDIIIKTIYGDQNKIIITPGMTSDKITEAIVGLSSLNEDFHKYFPRLYEWKVVRNRCFLEFEMFDPSGFGLRASFNFTDARNSEEAITSIIHIQGLRGNPARAYQISYVPEKKFQGTFENYVASVIHQWKLNDDERIIKLSSDLLALGLSWKITSRPREDTQVELQVGRLRQEGRTGASDLVSIADVGFGVSQVLPVLVALLVAEPGQLVYIEQPEIHLHPKAQVALAEVLADAAKRGVRVVAETHSSLLLLGIQTLVAEGKLDPSLVKLHWFELDEEGKTKVSSRDLDDKGRYGDFPVDFGDVELDAQDRYLTAVEQHFLES